MHFNTILKTTIVALGSALWAAGVATADGHSDVEKITDVLRSYESFVNESNPEGVGALYTEDAIFMPDRFGVFEGSEAITEFYGFVFNALTLNLDFTINAEDIVVTGSTAYAVTSSTGTRLIKESNQTVPEINRELWVFENVDDEWKIARYAPNKSE
ncbi:MAG: nuclear transport factor 2 family protein [Pseudomonadota bacterium]